MTLVEALPPGRSGSTSSLPVDVLEEARHRLSWACLVFLLGFLLAYFVPRVLFRERLPDGEVVGAAAASASMVLAVVLAALCRFSRVATSRLLGLGLVFEVVGSLAIATSEVWSFYSPQSVAVMSSAMVQGISWVNVWMIIFPALVPATRARTIAATVLSAPALPLVLIASHAYFGPPAEAPFYPQPLIGSALAGAISASLAILTANVIRGLGRKVREARQMGSYTLIERLSAGGMGEVWRAQHRLLARPAAVKLVLADAAARAGTDSTTAHRRFELEAQVTASLRCPNTIQLYDFGVADDGRLYYVMELLDGIDLERLVSEHGRLPPARAVSFLRQACRSLEEAHAQGLVHRDIKPANLFCCRYGLDLDFLKVLDFGVVRAPSVRATDDRLTGSVMMVGTPAYLAPETVRGDAEPDARTDLYALGCVAFWLLTGRLVFSAKTPVELAYKHLEVAPEPPSSFAPDIPPELDRIVLACLAKLPGDRPASAAALRDLLDRCPLPAPWTAADAAEWWSRHPPMAAQSVPKTK